MKMTPIAPILLSMLICGFAGATEVLFSGEKKQNNLVSELLEAASISKTGNPLTFTRSSDGWIFISANYKGQGTVRVILDKANDPVIVHDAELTTKYSCIEDYDTEARKSLALRRKGLKTVGKLMRWKTNSP